MNYLAHTLLSQAHIDYQLGNLLTDTLKGKAWQAATKTHRDGIIMHKRIDLFTDSHPVFDTARDRLGEGYLRGVVIDVVFDHFLSRHWVKFVRVPLDEFVNSFYVNALAQQHALPKKGQIFIKHIVKDNVLRCYDELDGLVEAFKRIDYRLSAKLRAKETVSAYFPILTKNYNLIEGDFLIFFPDLVAMFLRESKLPAEEHVLLTE